MGIIKFRNSKFSWNWFMWWTIALNYDWRCALGFHKKVYFGDGHPTCMRCYCDYYIDKFDNLQTRVSNLFRQ